MTIGDKVRALLGREAVVEPAHAGAPRPVADHWQERQKSTGGQVLVYELLAVAVGPQREPLRFVGWQGFAPFGSGPFSGPNHPRAGSNSQDP